MYTLPELDMLEAVAKRRRATRNFKPDAIDPELLKRLLDIARWAPSGYNLQPLHLFVVSDAEQRRALVPACMGQRQVAEAPVVVVFCGDRRVHLNNFADMLRMDGELGAMDARYEGLLRKFVPLAFARGPLGVLAAIKKFGEPILRLVTPTPSIPAGDIDYWLAKQVSLAAMNFMLAATAAGLATVPMEGFDESRVRRVLGIPRTMHIPLVIPVGYSADGILKKSRLPMERVVHWGRW